jgi:hypothetical protein
MSFLKNISKKLVLPTTAVAMPWRSEEGSILVEAMSNLRASSTGVEGTVIWISSGEFESKKSPHGPRIKLVISNKITTEGLRDAVSITLTKPPRVLGKLPPKVKKQAIAFVRLNLDALLAHWNGELDSAEVVRKIEKLLGWHL